jgi:hypothetical protein
VTVESRIRQMADVRRECATRLRFLDAGIWLGAPVGFPLARELPPEELPSVIGRDFITGGLVSHWRGKTVSAQDGNRALETIAAELPANVYTVWTGLPLYPAEPGPLPGRGELPPGVRGVRLFPKTHNYLLADWVIGSLCDWLVEHRLPLLVWHVELDWSALDALAGRFRKLNIIVETQTQKILYQNRSLFALMRRRRNVLAEISNLAGARMIEYCVREFGAERLIFGTFRPMNDPLVPIGMVIDAEISDSEKAQIAGGNLRRLIDGVKP